MSRGNAVMTAVDGVVLDLGVSSMQLDQAERGFSFRNDGPLDMRMGAHGPSAADVIARISERDLANVIFLLGEERHSRAVARAIVAERAEKRRSHHRRTRRHRRSAWCAQARRDPSRDPHLPGAALFVNEELTELAAALAGGRAHPAPGGRLVVVSFHSLEDRIVKTFLAGPEPQAAVSRHAPEAGAPQPTFTVLTKKPVAPDEAEIDEQSARALGQAARRRAHRRRGRADRHGRRFCRGFRRSPM